MKIIRGKPATGKPPMITCSGCGNRAREAGIAIPDDETVGKIHGPDVVKGFKIGAIIDEDEMQPLCESCLVALERAAVATTAQERMQ